MTALSKIGSMRNRQVLITGGAGFLGAIMAEALAEAGASIILMDILSPKLDKLCEQISKKYNVACRGIVCDLESEKSRLDAINMLKADNIELNCLINNAAFVGTSDLPGWSTKFHEQELSVWRRAIEVNLTAPFHLAKAFSAELKRAKGGNIINITSIYGQCGPDWRLYENTSMGNPAAYSVAKGGLSQLTRWLSTTLAPDIRVNAIAPGGIYRNQPKNFVDAYINKTPLGRMATEQDFKGAIHYLASDLSAYVTGQELNVSGGWNVW